MTNSVQMSKTLQKNIIFQTRYGVFSQPDIWNIVSVPTRVGKEFQLLDKSHNFMHKTYSLYCLHIVSFLFEILDDGFYRIWDGQSQANDSINTNSNSDAAIFGENSGENQSNSATDNGIVHSNSTLKN